MGPNYFIRPSSSNFAARRAAVRTEERAARRQPCRAATGHPVGRANLLSWLRYIGAIAEVRRDHVVTSFDVLPLAIALFRVPSAAPALP